LTRRRWIADEVSGDSAAITGAHAEHLIRVLRAKVGQRFDIVTGTNVREGLVTTVGESRVEFKLGPEIAISRPPAISLALAIFKFDRMEWAIEKSTELGVERIIPVVAKRTESHLARAAAKRVERWQRIARQASEQSRRSQPPEISFPVGLKDLRELRVPTRIVLSELEQAVTLRSALSGMGTGGIILGIGPEGGWTNVELDLFRASGWAVATLGPTILRAETAVIAALALVLAELQ
jgi:16S rRNA (uracil1498-N3)-methyltransferase